MTRILEDLSHAFYVITSVLLVSLLHGVLKMVTKVTETRRSDKQNCTAERFRNYVFVGFYTKIYLLETSALSDM